MTFLFARSRRKQLAVALEEQDILKNKHARLREKFKKKFYRFHDIADLRRDFE